VSRLASPAQVDVEASFQVVDLGKAEPFDSAWKAANAQTLCAARGADARGGVGPLGLWVLASDNLKEKTAVIFRLRVFKRADRGRQARGAHVQRSVPVVAGRRRLQADVCRVRRRRHRQQRRQDPAQDSGTYHFDQSLTW
jgi:hypothetical protein